MSYGGPSHNPSSSSAPMSVSSQPSQHFPSRSQHRPRPSLSQFHSPVPLQNTTAETQQQQQQQALSQQQQHDIMLQHHALMQQQQMQQQQQRQQEQEHRMQRMQEQGFYGNEMPKSQVDDSISPKSEPKEFCLVAEAARRAEMAVLLRDMAEVAL
ncbi:Ligand-binding domain of nuclear hormone receptor [Sticta canariensis]|nr:Ligand-binding domain of nuclear hormone receptor [Sticta canariensis]